MSETWLITGATGLLAPYLIDACQDKHQLVTTARSGGNRRCDLSDSAETRSLIDEIQPSIVLHAAGLTNVDFCEREPAAALAANRDTTANLANTLPDETRMIVFSTDQVYPDTPGLHSEAATDPVNAYGRSKLAGEAAATAHQRTLILRTNFFGASRTPGRASLSDFVADNLRAGRSITLFDDISFSPLHMTTLAALAIDLAEGDLTGTYNAGCRAGASKAAFGLAVASHLGLAINSATIGSSTSQPGRAHRTADLRLDVARLEAAAGRTMPTLEEEIAKLEPVSTVTKPSPTINGATDHE